MVKHSGRKYYQVEDKIMALNFSAFNSNAKSKSNINLSAFGIEEEEEKYSGLKVLNQPANANANINVIGAKPNTTVKLNGLDKFKQAVTAPSRFTTSGFGLFTKAMPQALSFIGSGLEKLEKGYQPTNNKLFEELDTKEKANAFMQEFGSIASIKAQSIGMGELSSISGGLGYLQRFGWKKAKPMADKLDEWVKEVAPEDPDFGDAIASGIGSVAVMYLPGGLIARGTALLAGLSPAIANLVGNSAMTLIESAMEAGGVYRNLKTKGIDTNEAKKQADIDFGINVALLALTNKFEFVGKGKISVFKEIKSRLASGAREFIQELGQQVAGNLTTYKQWDEGIMEAGAVGGILGALLGGSVNSNININVTTQKEIIELIKQAKKSEAGFAQLPAKKETSNLANLFDSQKGRVAVGTQELVQTLRGTKGMTADDITKKHPDIQLKKDVPAKDIHGNKVEIPKGEELTPYELKGNKVLLQDGVTYIVSKNQFANIKGQAVSGEAKPFAPELKGTEETVKGQERVFTKDNVENVKTNDFGQGGWEVKFKDNPDTVEFPLSKADDKAEAIDYAIKEMSGDTSKFSQYQLPDGKNYKEILIKAPVSKNPMSKTEYENVADMGEESYETYLDNFKKGNETASAGTFKSPHWDEFNVISHLRMNERTYKGEKVSFMEELQSDWAKEVRERGTPESLSKEGIPFGGTPSSPLLKNWQETTIKRALQEAVASNAKYFAWITGEQTSARYNLATQVKDVKWKKSLKQPDGGFGKQITIMPKEGTGNAVIVVIDKKGVIKNATDRGQDWKGKRLDEVLGKGLADKIMSKDKGTLSGAGLKFGGEWASNLYDKQVKNIVEDLTGAKVIKMDMELPIESKSKNNWFENLDTSNGNYRATGKITKNDLVVGKEIYDNRASAYIITDVLGDGKFKAVPKEKSYVVREADGDIYIQTGTEQEAEKIAKGIGGTVDANLSRIDSETFDISIKTTTQQGIELTPKVVAKIKGEAPKLKTSGKQFEEVKPIETFYTGAKGKHDKPKTPTGKEQLAEREAVRFKRTTAIAEKEALQFPDTELESQYQTFKKLKVKEVDDVAQLKSKNKAEVNEIDNILYSQYNTADEVLEMFKTRYSKEKVALPKLPPETKAVVAEKARQQVKSAKDILDSRRSKIKAVKSQFGLSDTDINKITRKDIRFMKNLEFKQFLDDLRTKAEQLGERKSVENILLQQIKDKELDIEPLRKAMKLPKIANMTLKQLQNLDDLLQPYLHGDVFLSQRKLETINRTELEGIRTYREARERLAKKLNIPVANLKNIKVSEFDRLRGDSALAERNPFYKMMVEETARVRLKRDTEFYEIENATNQLAKKLKTTVTQKIIPQQKNIRKWFEAKDKSKVKLTEPEAKLVEFMQDMWIEARDYLVEMEAMNKGINKDNYFTHIRRGTLEAVKEDGIIKASKEIYRQYQLDELGFNILDEQTGDVMALDKFFRFALKRTGELKPTENIVRSFLTYMKTFKKKQALDEIVPLVDIYANALTPKGVTKTGVLLHGNLIRFTKQWLNTKKGRHVSKFVKQGGKIDLTLRGLKTFTSLLDLAGNVTVSVASQVGEQVISFKLSGNKRFLLGKTRALTKQGKAITKKYTNLIGKNPWKELIEPAKEVGDRLQSGIFSMFADANWRRNRNVLLGSMTKEEFNAGELPSEKLSVLRTHIGRYGVISDAKSIFGATPEGRIYNQYKSWALPILRSELKNIGNLSKLFTKDKAPGKDALYQLGLTAEITGAVLIIKAMLGDEEDDSFIGKMKTRAYNEAMTILQALSPDMIFIVPRVSNFLLDLTTSLKSILLLEEYKVPGKGYKKGDLKGWNKIQRQLTPRAIKQFEGNEPKPLGGSSNIKINKIKLPKLPEVKVNRINLPKLPSL